MAEGRLWLGGLRRAWSMSGALGRWAADRAVTGVVYTPAAYEIDDAGPALASLSQAGARGDASLLWDLALTDIRSAADVFRSIYEASDSKDGYVAVWLDPDRANDPGRAVQAARALAGDVRRPNIAGALAWSPNRAGVVEALVGEGIAVALSGVRDAQALQAVAAAAAKGAEELKRKATPEGEQDLEPQVVARPVFVLAGEGDGEGVLGVRMETEFGLYAPGASPSRLPLSADAEQAGLKAAVDRLTQRAKLPGRADSYTPISFAHGVTRESSELREDEVLEDAWSRDHTAWSEDPTELADRLGWLDAPARFSADVRDLVEFGRKARAGGDITRVVVCGMGGSVFAPEMFDNVVGGGIPLTVVDTTHPDAIAAVTASLDLEHTMFVVSSKSGTTAETRSHLEYFWSLVPRGDRFVCVTDPGTPLADVARERGFARVFENPPEIGGRFSGLSYFGLVPAALAGVDIEAIVSGARRQMVANGPGVAEPYAPGVRLGAAIGEAVLRESRDKLTFVLPRQLDSFGVWVEQMLCESLGKQGKGIVPVLGEPLASPDSYGSDRVFFRYVLGPPSEATAPPQLEAIEGEFPIITVHMADAAAVGAEMYRWEMATAIVGYMLDINPFDQPDVEAAKQRAREALQREGGAGPDRGSLADVLKDVGPPRYIGLQAFLPPNTENAAALERVRSKLRERYGVPVTVGFGPRFLHSTGQLHKGGPGTGAFVQITGAHASDVEVPGMGYTFGRLIDAQADGDLQALRDVGRSAARVAMEELASFVGE